MMYLIAFVVAFIAAFLTNPTNKSAVYSVFVLGFTFQYSIAVASIILTHDSWMAVTAWEYRVLALLLVILSFTVASFVILMCGPRVPFPVGERSTFGQLNLVIVFLSIIGLALLIDSTDLLSYGSRLMSRAGHGYIFIFGFLAFAAALNFPLFAPGERPKWSWTVLVFAIVFFMIAGYRSFVMFCLLGIILSHVGASAIIGRSRFALFSAALNVISVPINFVTGALRSLASTSQGEVDYDSVAALAHDLAERQTVPMANTHLDILAFYLQRASFSDTIYGTDATIVSSISNFLPRFLFADKGQTTGVLMAQELFPEWFYAGQHTSSVTVGLVFEMIFNFGVPLGVLMVGVFIMGACLFCRAVMRVPVYGTYFAPILVWCFFFNIFFDDLGGIVNKVVLTIVGFLLVAAVHHVLAGGGRAFRHPRGYIRN